jgi:hypothetical protein
LIASASDMQAHASVARTTCIAAGCHKHQQHGRQQGRAIIAPQSCQRPAAPVALNLPRQRSHVCQQARLQLARLAGDAHQPLAPPPRLLGRRSLQVLQRRRASGPARLQPAQHTAAGWWSGKGSSALTGALRRLCDRLRQRHADAALASRHAAAMWWNVPQAWLHAGGETAVAFPNARKRQPCPARPPPTQPPWQVCAHVPSCSAIAATWSRSSAPHCPPSAAAPRASATRPSSFRSSPVSAPSR